MTSPLTIVSPDTKYFMLLPGSPVAPVYDGIPFEDISFLISQHLWYVNPHDIRNVPSIAELVYLRTKFSEYAINTISMTSPEIFYIILLNPSKVKSRQQQYTGFACSIHSLVEVTSSDIVIRRSHGLHG
jgi:hypothetical protein